VTQKNSNHPGPELPPLPEISSKRQLTGWLAGLVSLLAIGLSVFQVYTAGFGTLTAMFQRSIHVALILSLAFIIHPPAAGPRAKKNRLLLGLDLVLVVLALGTAVYIIVNFDQLVERQGDWLTSDYVFAGIATLLVLEATRRTIGLVMTLIAVFFLAYAYCGPWLPEFMSHRGYSVTRILSQLYLTTEGIYGLPTGVAATFVFIFILFGAFLEKTGGGNFFIDLAYALTGRMRGGPAKTAVLASGFMGSVSGSAIANTVTTGSFTIPMMKKIGYKPHVAGAIEAAASTGGQLMPPIMGAGAFLMAEFTNTSYLHIIKVAAIPAIMYYFSVIMFVHFEACKEGFEGQAASQLPAVRETVKNGFHFLLPIAILVGFLLANFSPMMAGFIAVVTTYLASCLRRASRLSFRQLLGALELGARNAIVVSVACACAGIIVGMVGLTGIGLKFSSLVVSLSGGIKLLAIMLIGLASLVLGMGLPVTASYIVLVILAGPALTDMGVPLVAAHMIVFWYSQDANVTPPVALASFAAAGIAGASPMECGFASWKIAKGLYIIPILMAYRPLLLNGPPLEVANTIACGFLGLWAFTAFLEGYLFNFTRLAERAALGLACLLLFWPAWPANLAGAVLLAAVIFTNRKPGWAAAG